MTVRPIDYIKAEFKKIRPYNSWIEKRSAPMQAALNLQDLGMLTLNELFQIYLTSKKTQYHNTFPENSFEINNSIITLGELLEKTYSNEILSYKISNCELFNSKRDFIIKNVSFFYDCMNNKLIQDSILEFTVSKDWNIHRATSNRQIHNLDEYRLYNLLGNHYLSRPLNRMDKGDVIYYSIKWELDNTQWDLKEVLFFNQNKSKSTPIKAKFNTTLIKFNPQLYLIELINIYLSAKRYKLTSLFENKNISREVLNLELLLNMHYSHLCVSRPISKDSKNDAKIDLIHKHSWELFQSISEATEKHIFILINADIDKNQFEWKVNKMDSDQIESVRYSYPQQYLFSKFNPGSKDWSEGQWVYFDVIWTDESQIWKFKEKVKLANYN